MKIAVLKEVGAETRVAAIPETVRKLIALGASVAIEEGAGASASVIDQEYRDAGADIRDRASLLSDADIIMCVSGPEPDALQGVKPGALLIGALDPVRRGEAISAYGGLGLDALAMEWMPRITRAQSMDILSSQSNLAGYKAVVDAASIYRRAFPMMMTAAGTISPAKVFVMGVGVAGLQAIATAKRLGAQVSATDVRSATREQIQSLGAKPIFVENVAGIEGEGKGGYAEETSPEYQAAQAELVSGHIAKQDIVITTALIPGRPAPRLISDAQLATMRAGSVVIDLAAEAGGNVEGCVAGEAVERHGVTVIGAVQLARTLAADSSALFARNLYNFLAAFWDKDGNAVALPEDDEIVQAIRLTSGGKIVNDRLLG
ncbi:NAD(P) transhydrogenase subunit alpha [Sphingomonas sp. LY160]|uniref:NAD(P) transhydrogenase subunit alpha n=1 Tax=Sphingomonas sp. LY160 TaxID=3095342 RepID=UPI002ADEAFAC|nr:NAD(P) transhydrogenase subunit alpha [Sphingomonas sp. LY160]MEA1071003.1 NAD(P) transhydrogenase subunit alpha [Sphingomonas sp. LY160]